MQIIISPNAAELMKITLSFITTESVNQHGVYNVTDAYRKKAEVIPSNT